MRHIVEPERKTPVRHEADVIVVGAGPAGIGGAIGAARAGARVVLVEKHGCVGGMLTAGSVLNIRQYTDGRRQIIGGVAAELADRIRAAGGTDDVPSSGRHVRQDPEITKYVAQEMILDAGVKLLLHTCLVGAVNEGGSVKGVLVENKGGRSAILAPVTIDCTGDGDVIWHAGAGFEKRGADLQPMTLAFIMGGVSCWPDGPTEQVRERIRQAVEDGSFPIARRPALFPLRREGWMYANATRIPGDCTDPDDLTRGEIEGRRQVFALVEWLRSHAPGYENAYVVSTAPQVGLRESRRLKGLYTLTREDVLGYRQFDDAIALGAYGIDIHYPGAGGQMTRLEPGKCYGVPLRCLVPEKTDGLLAAGRCISVTPDALGSTRVMATCAAIGHGAGVTAARAAEAGLAPRDVAADEVRTVLAAQGAMLATQASEEAVLEQGGCAT